MKHERIALCLGFLMVSVTALAQKVTTDFAEGTDFSRYKTYAWGKGTPAKNPLMDERIVSAIDEQLAAKGLQKVDAATNPDLLVAYHAAVTEEAQLSTTGYGSGWRYGGGMSTTQVQRIPIGHLVVDIGDVKDKKLLWRGQASDTLSDKPEKVAETINKAAEKMFKKYPPEAKAE